MAYNSDIEWTETTWNPVTGCTKISPGCKFCYAERFAERFRGVKGHPYESGFDLRMHADRLEQPLHWKESRIVFVNSMSDLFHDEIPAEFRRKVFQIMEQAAQHTFQVLTKRADKMLALCREDHLDVPPNVWMGVSVETQEYMTRIDLLRQVPARVRFLSCEPLLGPLRLDLTGIHWVIIGGESGPGARPMEIQWARDIIAQCQKARVRCFVKQLGAKPSFDGYSRFRLRDKKGGDPLEWPPFLRIREMPALG